MTTPYLSPISGAADRLFMGVVPTGIRWADRAILSQGDYKPLALLLFATLKLTIEADCPAEYRSIIESYAAAIQARKGDQYQVSTSGQTVILGWELP